MRQVLRAGALGRPRGMGWRGRQEGGSGWETHVNPWLIHVTVWQKPLQYCKVISLQLVKINGKNNLKKPTKCMECSAQFSHSVMYDSLPPHGLQHARLPCPSPTPRVAQTHVLQVGTAIQPSHPLSSTSPAFNLQSSGSFPMSQLFTSGGQSIGVSASTSVLPMNIQD